MTESTVSFITRSQELKKAGAVVGLTDRIYDLSGDSVTFDEVLPKGDLSGVLDYNGARLSVVGMEEMIGMLVDDRGARGPVWKGVRCTIVHE